MPKYHEDQNAQNSQLKSNYNYYQTQTLLNKKIHTSKRQTVFQKCQSARALSAQRSNSNISNVNSQISQIEQNSQKSTLPNHEPPKFSRQSNGFVLSYGANTNQGIYRNYNEDRVSIILNFQKPKERSDVIVWPKCSFFGVFDGHGGTKCADFLRDNLHNFII